MPVSPHNPRPRRAAAPTFNPRRDPGSALVQIDEAPLKSAAWAELHAARKRQEKAARDLHRHEEVDRPAYDAWLHRTFPTLITQLRELHQEVFAKGQRVQSVLFDSAMTGRSARKIWRERKADELMPKADEPEPDAEPEDHRQGADREDDPDAEDDFFDDDHGFGRSSRQPWRMRWTRTARDRPVCAQGRRHAMFYRRLVQRLHPDRGGEWTGARQRLWHEVQEAWAAGDADWLMRLDVEWEATHDVLSPTSALSRLRRASEELHAARRDTERKLRSYRGSPPWRFTLAEKNGTSSTGGPS